MYCDRDKHLTSQIKFSPAFMKVLGLSLVDGFLLEPELRHMLAFMHVPRFMEGGLQESGIEVEASSVTR